MSTTNSLEERVATLERKIADGERHIKKLFENSPLLGERSWG